MTSNPKGNNAMRTRTRTALVALAVLAAVLAGACESKKSVVNECHYSPIYRQNVCTTSTNSDDGWNLN